SYDETAIDEGTRHEGCTEEYGDEPNKDNDVGAVQVQIDGVADEGRKNRIDAGVEPVFLIGREEWNWASDTLTEVIFVGRIRRERSLESIQEVVRFIVERDVKIVGSVLQALCYGQQDKDDGYDRT